MQNFTAIQLESTFRAESFNKAAQHAWDIHLVNPNP